MHNGELLPGLALPPAYHGAFRQRVAEVDTADTAVNYLIARARAEGLVEAMEVMQALDSSRIERLYLLIDEAATARLLQLDQESGA